MSPVALSPTVDAYAAIFEEERAREYPVIDDLEARFGYALDRARLEGAARVLACPLKAHAPSWQHGRVLYAMTRRYLVERGQPVNILDIGTAKGFSALCLQWALDDAKALGCVTSVDVLNPHGTERRNSVLELSGPKRLKDFLQAWPEADNITFLKSTGVDWLNSGPQSRIHVAFVDGKHTGAVVWHEGRMIALRQHAGDLVLFDDVQIDGVALAVQELAQYYDVETIALSPDRQYGLGVRRG